MSSETNNNKENQMQNGPRKEYHILALSGGGFRGLYTATVLEELEKNLDRPIAKHFDLICGTSVGGLIALALAAEIPASEIKSLFLKEGHIIFKKSKIPGLSTFLSLFQSKYNNKGLKKAIENLFLKSKIQTLGDLNHPVIIPSINYTTGKPQIFKTPHHQNFQTDHKLPLIDVALSTSAAPTYFPIHKTEFGNFVDGGLVANSPGLFGYHEVTTFYDEGFNANIRLLSIGTMSAGSTIKSKSSFKRGILGWGKDLINLILSSQESSTDYLLKHLLNENYLRIDSNIPANQLNSISLDNVTEEAKTFLIQHGIEDVKKIISTDFKIFKSHLASLPTFYYGTNKKSKGNVNA